MAKLTTVAIIGIVTVFAIIIIISVWSLIGPLTSSPATNQISKSTFTVETDLENSSRYVTLSYNCNDIGNSIVECSGSINYIGPETGTTDGQLFLYCYKDLSPTAECTLDTQSIKIQDMNKISNTQPFTLYCGYHNEKNFKVKLFIPDGMVIFPMYC